MSIKKNTASFIIQLERKSSVFGGVGDGGLGLLWFYNVMGRIWEMDG